MPIKRIIKNKKGDTIVEVLIGIAVLGLVLSISYSLANRNTQYIQQSQERGEAQKISEAQLELLRNYLTPETDWSSAGYKCFNDNSPPQPTATAAQCQKGTRDSGVGRYRVRINYDSSTKTYTVNTTWSSLTSVPQQTLALSYKLPASALAPVGLGPACRDHLDNDGDTHVDLADPGCLGDPNRNTEVDPPTQLIASVKKIPPLPGNLSPGCSRAATANRSGSRVSLSDGQVQFTGGNSSTTFAAVTPNASYNVTVTPPSSYTICPPSSQTRTTGSIGSVTQFDFKIAPICGPSAVWHSGYSGYNWGNRRADLDGYYYTWPPAVPAGTYPGADTQFVAGNVRAPGVFWYKWSGDWSRIGEGLLYYWLWEAVYYYVPGYYTYDGPYTCP
ncbi:MAG TPA: hypothetical protein VFW77_04675 [Candidatus Saccharimonadales bacterium]|nr:hypothetical protein [Candidatus Saccharimonadales bacterium]